MTDSIKAEDPAARFWTKVSILASLATAVFAWASSPYYFASPNSLTFAEYYTVHLDAEGKVWGELNVRVANNAWTPARGLTFRFESLDENASPSSTMHWHRQIYRGPDGKTSVIVMVPILPAGKTESVVLRYTLNETLNQLREARKSQNKGPALQTSDFRYAALMQAAISDVCVERGQVKRHPDATTRVGVATPTLQSNDIADYSGSWD